MDIQITQKQQKFIEATADEVLFGGAAGGGKSYGQIIDAFLYAMRHAGSKQVIFRRTFPELEKSILREMLNFLPRDVYKYNDSKHTFLFGNGSLIDCGHLQYENNVYDYQSAEYDVIRFDELTHFTAEQYTYMMSRLRGVNGFPKSMRSSTNPTGEGRLWVKERFIGIGAPDKTHTVTIGYRPDGSQITGTRIFIPSKVRDNIFLMEKDPDYLNRLENLSEDEKRGLLYGEWDGFEGQYFSEFRREIHVCEPFTIPKSWHVYRTIDYGLDMLACYWVAVDTRGYVYVTKELCESDLTISDAATKILSFTSEEIYSTLAPPDLWNRSQETGRSKAIIFDEAGLRLTKSNNDREAGWLAIKELLKTDKEGTPRLKIFSNCIKLIKHLPALARDPKHPTDCAKQPHEITHSPDSLRYFAIAWVYPPEEDIRVSVRKTPFELRTDEDEGRSGNVYMDW